MPFKKILWCAVVSFFSFSSGVALASKADSMDVDDFDATLRTIKEVCEPIRDLELVSEEDLTVIEDELGPIPTQLRTFLKECGRLSTTLYDILGVYRREKRPASEFLRTNKSFLKEHPEYKEYHVFCNNNGDFFMIHSMLGFVRYWRHYDNKLSGRKSDQWSSFNQWLKDALLPAQESKKS